MPNLFKNLKSRAEALYQSDDEHTTMKYKRGGRAFETRTLNSTVLPAACRGLYATPTQRRCIKSNSNQVEQLNRTCDDDDDDDDDDNENDAIIRHSMYPQINGKRRSKLEAEHRIRTTKYDLAVAGKEYRERRAGDGYPVRPKHSPRRVRRPRPVKSEFSSDSNSDTDSDADSDCSSDVNPEGRPIRVCMYPQAKYVKEPVIKPPMPRMPSYRNWKRENLPYDEFQILHRRQVMQRARDVLEPYFLHRGTKAKKGLVGHGEMQCFTEYHTARRQTSRIQYAVRKAMQADLNQCSPEFGQAMTRRAQKERFCEMSDVDGVPVDEKLMVDFIKAHRKFQEKAYTIEEQKLAMVWFGELAQRSSIDEPCRIDSGATMRAPPDRSVLISQFDWNSSDDESEAPKLFGKKNR
ncbi:uncharacterized protein M421DRAFT_424614 [Didymella exigua CBS 183.55]|uniref:Uncharacterized protein n=1 Tax=Didymella exigua CBS 183.55 TaxID=1150837 RepID=A0A6A5RGH9_9PLEO|nr:uncharacterized protein M421DRAFT_424614 [Didymella exigua CBS 183.55]KAF1924727.1 hypothetical protein M421DRAFT_424614 [Didymella exigua CBS 183.55]